MNAGTHAMCVWVWECLYLRVRETEGQRDIQRDIQRDREAEGLTDREMQRNRESDRVYMRNMDAFACAGVSSTRKLLPVDPAARMRTQHNPI